MKILIVGPLDDFFLGSLMLRERGATMTARAFCLEQALECPEKYDGVVCAQSFTTQMRGSLNPDNWDRVAEVCQERSIPMVLVLNPGEYDLAATLNARPKSGWAAVALVEPVEAEFVAETICDLIKCAPARESGVRVKG